MHLRKAKLSDLDQMNKILRQAKQYLKDFGSTQWQSGDPNDKTLKNDIMNCNSYCLVNADSQVIAFAALMPGSDPNYSKIWDGKWINDSDDYMAIHRVAISKKFRNQGIGAKFLDLLVNTVKAKRYKSARIDTFELNLPMQKVAKKVGFKYCGKVAVIDPIDPKRYAYELVFSE